VGARRDVDGRPPRRALRLDGELVGGAQQLAHLRMKPAVKLVAFALRVGTLPRGRRKVTVLLTPLKPMRSAAERVTCASPMPVPGASRARFSAAEKTAPSLGERCGLRLSGETRCGCRPA